MSKCFIDTNVWLYAFINSKDQQKHTIANKLILQEQNNIIISTQVINEISVNLIKQLKFSELLISQLITAFYDKYKVVDFRQDLLLFASDIRKKHSLSFWDSLIVSCASTSSCNVLYSEDMHHGMKIKDLKIINPFK